MKDPVEWNNEGYEEKCRHKGRFSTFGRRKTFRYQETIENREAIRALVNMGGPRHGGGT